MSALFLLLLSLLFADPEVFFSSEYEESVDVSRYFPIAPGTRWDYVNSYRTRYKTSEDIAAVRWVSSLEVIRHVQTPQGLVDLTTQQIGEIERENFAGLTEDDRRAFMRIPTTAPQHILIQGNYLFHVPAHHWSDEENSFSVSYLERLEAGSIVPDLFFPPSAARVWAEATRERADLSQAKAFKSGEGPAPNPSLYYWHFEGVETFELGDRKLTAYHFKYYAPSGSPIVWFVPGVGIVKRQYAHAGGFIERESVLIQFREGDSG